MSTCNYCKNEVDENSLACPKCGRAIISPLDFDQFSENGENESSISQESILTSHSPQYLINTRDFIVGFFGWVILSNLIFFTLLTFFGIYFTSIALWLLAIISPVAFIAINRKWIGSGILVAVIINIILFAVQTDLPPFALIFPFPIGYAVFSQ